MEQFDRFCQSVCRQVRFATAEERNSIRRELHQHPELGTQELEAWRRSRPQRRPWRPWAIL